MKTKLNKVFGLFLIGVVLCSLFCVSASAESFQSIAPVSFSDFSGDYTAVAFPGASSLTLSCNGAESRNYLNSDDFLAHDSRIKYGTFFGVPYVPYIQIHLSCHYSSVYLNSDVYSGSNSASTITASMTGVTTFECSAVENSYSADVTYFYTWNIILDSAFDYEQVYKDAFTSGVNSDQAKDKWSEEAYQKGLSDGLASKDSANLGANLIGDTLSMPVRALNQFVLFTSPSGINITLGMIFGSMIALMCFLAFLKMFAGG